MGACADALRELRGIAERLNTLGSFWNERGLHSEQINVVQLVQSSNCPALAELATHVQHEKPEQVLVAWRNLVVYGLEPEESKLPKVANITVRLANDMLRPISTSGTSVYCENHRISEPVNPWLEHARRVVGVLIARVEKAATTERDEAASPGAATASTADPLDDDGGMALTVNQSRVLQTMARFDGARLVSSKMIVEEMDTTTRLSEETVRQCVRKLIESNLADRPEGDRSGARLTIAGRRLAGKIAD